MIRNFSLLTASLLVFVITQQSLATVIAQPRFAVGKLKEIVIDGNAMDWENNGMQINIFNPMGDFDQKRSDYYPRCRFGWDDRGLLFLAEVSDDEFVESDNNADIWRADGIELFVGSGYKNEQRLQLLIAPGMDPNHPQVRFHLNNLSQEIPLDAENFPPQVACIRHENSYVLEALIPWQNLRVHAIFRNVSLQVYFNDLDQDGKRKQYVWYPSVQTYSDSTQMYEIQLNNVRSYNPISVMTKASIHNLRWLNITVTGIKELDGKSCSLRRGNDGYDQTKTNFKVDGDFAYAYFQIPFNIKNPLPDLNVVHQFSPDYSVAVEIPDINEIRWKALLESEIKFDPSTIIKTDQFPVPNFSKPLYIEELIGSYRIETEFYDAQCNVVKRAEKPGRYGAVIKIICKESGKTHTRYRTIYRMPVNAEPWDMTVEGDVKLPTQYGIDPAIATANQKDVNAAMNWSFWDIAQNASFNAALLSSLSEMKADEPVTVYTGPMTREKQYWTTLERKLNHNDTMFYREFAMPAKLDKPATTLHEGSMTEAGMTDDAPQKIDAILTQWANDTDEAFIACVVRNGVIVHHKAYGTRDDKPMTTNTLSWMASLSKLISGTMAMMMVDQQLINLDTPIDRYLPELGNAGFKKIPTTRNLWTHTAGLTSHRGEDDPDLEHLIASIAPDLKVGKKFEYDGMGLELGIQLLGQISGECYPTMVKTHLLDPLGCDLTECLNASWNTRSTAMEMATIGQMLLNGGAYGNYRFMSEETRDAMLPIDISTITTDQSATQYGIGTQWFKEDGLSDRCFAHGAASAATLRIDLNQNLVIAMTRNNAGKNYGKYHPMFIKTVTDCIKDK